MNPAYLAIGISVTLGLAFIGMVWKFGTWYGAVNTDRSKFEKAIDRISDKVDEILGRLPSPPVSAASPLRLTEIGKQISQDIGAEEWAESESAALLQNAEGKDPFGIQAIAFEYANEFEPPDTMLASMRDSAFNNGLDLEGVRRVLGVVLRDRLLRERGLLPSSLDGQD